MQPRLAFVVAEALAGWFGGSLALLSDAGHNLADAAALAFIACSCHIVVAEQSVREGQQVLRAVAHDLDHEFRITHSTIQMEVEGCAADDMYCMGLHAAGSRERRLNRADRASSDRHD